MAQQEIGESIAIEERVELCVHTRVAIFFQNMGHRASAVSYMAR